MAHERRKGALISNFFFHPTICIWLAARQKRRNLHETPCVLLGCLSPTSPLLYWRSNDLTDNKVLHFGALLNCSALCCSAFQSLPFLFPPADQVTKSKHAAMVDSMMVDHFYTLHSGPSEDAKAGSASIGLGWLTGWCQRDNKQMELDLIGSELFMALCSGAQLICLLRKGAWPLNNRSSSAAGGTELLTW